MKNLVNFFLVSFLLCSSCVRNYKIPPEDYSLLPYKGHETLVFHSSKGDIDTIFLEGEKRFASWTNQWSLFPKNAEYLDLIAKRSDPTEGKQRYLDSSKFVTLINDGESKLCIDFTAKAAWFYGDSIYTKKALLKAKTINIQIGNTIYNDVIVLIPNKEYHEKVDGKLVDRSNTIYKLYWSKKSGFIGYDKKNEQWVLIKRY